MHNILITGANGQLGCEIRELSEKWEHANKYFFTDANELNITDKSEISVYLERNEIDIVVNCAAYTNVDQAEDDREMADLVNHIGVKNLADVCKETNTLLMHISTDYVFNGSNNIPYVEIDCTNPLGIYGETKLNGEKSIVNSGCEYVILRTSWLYSSYGKNFLKTIQKLTAERETINVVFDQVGTPTYARDLANAILLIIDRNNSAIKNHIYHFSNEGVCSWYDFALAINESFEHGCKIHPCHSNEFPSKVSRPSFSVLDKTKIKRILDIEIPHWRESVATCVRSIIDRDKN